MRGEDVLDRIDELKDIHRAQIAKLLQTAAGEGRLTPEEAGAVYRRMEAEARGVTPTWSELVGLVPEAARSRCSEGFLARSGIGPERSVEGRLAG